MNNTTADAAQHVLPPHDLHTTLAAAFFGFSAGAILFGMGVRQLYQYFTTCKDDSRLRKLIVGSVCTLDGLHLAFSMYLVYSLILYMVGYTNVGPHLVWSLKALGSTQVILIILVQGFYLWQIWRFSGNEKLLARRFTVAVQLFVIFISLFALAVAGIFLSQLQQITVIRSFEIEFEYIVYLGFGATAIIDCAIATAMCLILHKSSSGTIRSETVLETLIKYFIGSGLLTSFAAILIIVLYVAQPNSVLYLAMELSVTHLYANSLLAISNSRKDLRAQMNKTFDIEIPSGVFFREPDQISLIGAHLKDPFSPDNSEVKYSNLVDANPFATPTKKSYLGIPLSDPFSPGAETKYSPTDSESGKSLSRSSSSRSHTV